MYLCEYIIKEREGEVMSLFKGPMSQHIDGRKKLTEEKKVIELLNEENVWIPLYATHTENFELFVKEGDQVFVGTKLAQTKEGFFVPIYASVSGTVSKIEKRLHSSTKEIDHIMIQNDKQYTVKSDLQPLDYTKHSKEELVDFMMQAGIVGCGGASFPTYVKYKGVTGIQQIIINAVECEPYITTDYKMIEEDVQSLKLGILAMMKMVDAPKAIIGVKKTHPELIQQIRECVKDTPQISVYETPDRYPMGWERVLVKEITKKDYNRLPSEIGIVENNASTAIAFANALTKGLPIVSKIVTVSGDAVKNPCNVQVPVGTPASALIQACGGYTEEKVSILAGGPMMGRAATSDDFVIDRASGAITILKYKQYEAIACLRCGKCSDCCPAALQPVRINQAVKTNDITNMEKLNAMDCIECGLCSYVCPSRIEVTNLVRLAKTKIREANSGK